VRPDLDVVAAMVPPGSRVLDLGCGDGALLEHLLRMKGCDGLGIERSDDGVHACIARGVPVLQADIDAGLGDIETGGFDVVVLSQTLQATHRPALVLAEMRRVAPHGIVSFPNFGHWRVRAQLALRGRMPVAPSLPYAWHDTPNIHLCTIADFERLAASEGIRVAERALLDAEGRRAGRGATLRPNLLAAGTVLLLEHPAR
jgi:methionine biosynthesis protein MetW